MQATRGKANPGMVNKILRAKLGASPALFPPAGFCGTRHKDGVRARKLGRERRR